MILKNNRVSMLIAAVASVSISVVAHGATYIWAGTASDVWGDSTKWTPNGVPNASGDGATIDAATTGNVKIDSVFTVGALTFSRATTLETTPAAFDPALGLTLAVPVGSPTITTTADVFYYASLFGSQGFTKAGANKFTFRFNSLDQTYSGPINIAAGVLGINQAGSLGDVNNDITIGNGARLLAEPGSNSGTITLPSTRTITLAGAQSQIGANNANVTLIVEGDLLESAAGNGLVITDNGKVVLAGNVGYTGETRLAGGTLALSGPAMLPTAQNLRFNGGAAATLDLGGASQTVRTIVMEGTGSPLRRVTNGNLIINGDANQQSSGRNAQTFDFSGLDSFTYNRSNRAFNFQTTNVAAVTTITDMNLAKSGANGGTNTITASAILVGGGNSDGNNGNTARLHLGMTNTFNTASLQIGGFNAGGVVDFQSSLVGPTLKLRGVDGASALPVLKIGETSSGSRRGEGVLNLGQGVVDALVTDTTIGRHVANSNNADTSYFTMVDGSFVTSTLTLAQKVGTGTPVLTATVNQGGGIVRANTILMGTDAGAGATPKLLPSYFLTGGTLFAGSIDGGAGAFAADSARTLSINGGTLRNLDASTDLLIDGVDATAAGLMNIVIDTNGARFQADAGRSITLTSLAPVTGNGLLDKTGDGSLVLNTTVAGSVRVSTGSLTGAAMIGDNAGSDSLLVLAGAILSPGNGIGSISVGGAVDLNGTLAIDANLAGASDLLAVAGPITLGTSSVLDLLAGSSLDPLQSYTIATGIAVTGPFGSVDAAILATHSVDYSANMIRLTPVPEPTLALIPLLGMVMARRR